jgi:hypothetical protein
MKPDRESAPTGSAACARGPIASLALASFACLASVAALACARTPVVASPASAPAAPAPAPPPPGARFNAAGELEPPTDYRTWVFLTSGFAMSYGPAVQAAAAGGVDVLDNVYVSPDAYRGFMATGVWPEATMFVLEIRTAEETGSIVTRGRFQTELVAVEAAVKDTRRWPGGWGYFDFHTDGGGPTRPAKALPPTASCYKCHASHGAVEQTFTQFYPTLFEVARARGTVRPDFPGVPPGARELEVRIAQGGWAAGKTLLDDTATRWPNATVLREPSLNRAAYRLQREHGPASLALFEEIARRFPASANAWDNLAEAYEKSGASDKAQQAVERGLAVVAGDRALPANARGSIEQSLKGRRDRLKR